PMSKALADPAAMIRRGTPRLIRSEDELVEYTRVLFALTAKPKPTAAEQEAIDLLTLLVDITKMSATPSRKLAPSRCCGCCSNGTASPRAS
ncbi:MAG TPA: hypothetical protein VL990_12020, partial [Acidobacteriaceae bacterium]|nr:hypothetical protein [Acidobacteriaceae bacterium]